MNNTLHIIPITFSAILIAQSLKFLIEKTKKSNKGKNISFSGDGGMPSVHSVTVSSLSTAVYLMDGFTTLFSVTVIFSLIVMYDAMHIRREVGYHAEQLNKLTKKNFKEKTGHTLKEVIVGIAMGIFTAIIYFQFL